MIYKSICSFFVFFILPLFSYAQDKEKLLEIITSNHSIEVRQQKLDSFFLINTKEMSSEVLADCYHDYSARWYYFRWSQENNSLFLKQAILYAKKAARIRRKTDAEGYKELKKSLNNIGFFNFLLENYFAAIHVYSELVSIGDLDMRTMQTYRMLGNSYGRIGDFYKAMDSFGKVIVFCEKNTEYEGLLIDAYIDRADTYSSMGYREFSEQIYADLMKADSILKKNKPRSKYSESQIQQIEGNRLLETGNYSEAIPFFKESLKGVSDNDSISLAIIYNSLGLSQLKLLNFKEALVNSKKAIEYNPDYSSPYENLGDYYIEKGEFEQALIQYQKAIVYAIGSNKEIKPRSKLTIKNLELASKKDELLRHIISKANAWVDYYKYDQNKNHLTQAIQTFKLADQLVDLIRFESTEYKSKLFWREQGASLYMNAVATCYLLNKPVEAYYFMEKNKALLLLEDITNEQAKENAKIPNHIARREFELKREIFLSENELQNIINVLKDTLLLQKDKIYEHKRTYEKFVDSLSIAFPDYAVTKKKVEILPFDGFKKKYTSDKEMVLQYIVNDEQGFGLLNTATESLLFKINNVEQLNRDIFTLHKQLSQPFSNKEQLTTYEKVSNQVFKKLIPKNIHETVKGKNLTIVPDYILQQLSFETLVADKNMPTYLIEETETRYVYSMSYLDRNQQVNRNPENNFVGFAPIIFNTTGLSDLVLSKDEVTSIEKLYDGEVLLNTQATKKSFLDRINNYKIIHLSTHADVGDTENPWVAFTDGKVSLNEIYASKNQSDMVVLSACKTSLGELKKGEGVMSLARGFFHSGTKSVVSSLWSTNDKTNMELMIGFYKNLDRGLTKSAALRKIKLNYMNSHTGSELSPFYWGSLILIGDNETLQLPSELSNWSWIGIFVILITTTILFYIKRNKK